MLQYMRNGNGDNFEHCIDFSLVQNIIKKKCCVLIFLPLQLLIINITTAALKSTRRVPKIQVQVPPKTQVQVRVPK